MFKTICRSLALNKTKIFTLIALTQHNAGKHKTGSAAKKAKQRESKQIVKEIKLFLVVDYMIVYIKNVKGITKNPH